MGLFPVMVTRVPRRLSKSGRLPALPGLMAPHLALCGPKSVSLAAKADTVMRLAKFSLVETVPEASSAGRATIALDLMHRYSIVQTLQALAGVLGVANVSQVTLSHGSALQRPTIMACKPMNASPVRQAISV